MKYSKKDKLNTDQYILFFIFYFLFFISQADPELTSEFFENILEGLSVEHDSTTRTNRLYIQLEGELR